ATGGVDDVVSMAQRHGGVVVEEPRLVGQPQPRAAGGDDGGGRPDEVGEVVRGGCVVGGEVVGVEREGELAGAHGPRPTVAEAVLGGALDVVGDVHAPDPVGLGPGGHELVGVHAVVADRHLALEAGGVGALDGANRDRHIVDDDLIELGDGPVLPAGGDTGVGLGDGHLVPENVTKQVDEVAGDDLLDELDDLVSGFHGGTPRWLGRTA